MTRRASILVLGLSLGLSCTKLGSTPANPDEADATPSAPAPAGPAPAGPSGPRFWVARHGLHAYDLDGNELGSFGDRGDVGRRLPDGRIVVVESSPLGDRLSVLDPEGTPTLELELPTVFDDETCSMSLNVLEHDEEGEPFRAVEGLSMQSDRDFWLDAKGTHACITLLDRNENMSDYSIELAVDLATGTVHSSVGYEPNESCPETGLAACTGRNRQETPWVEDIEIAAAPKSWTHAYDPKTGVLSREGKAVRELCVPKDRRGADWEPEYGCAMVEEQSSNGRWQLISAMHDDSGDHILRLVYVLDLETAALSTIVCKDEAPCTLGAVAFEDLYQSAEPMGYDAVGESEVGTLPGDRFWIDGMLVIPGDGRVVAIGGTRVMGME